MLVPMYNEYTIYYSALRLCIETLGNDIISF